MAQQDASTPDVGKILADDNFKQLPLDEKNKVLMRIDPNFAGLAEQERQKVLMKIQYPGTQFEKDREPGNEPGFWKTVGQDVKGVLGGVLSAPGGNPLDIAASAARGAASVTANDAIRKHQGRSGAYRAVAGVGELAGVNAAGMEDAADVGSKKGVLAHTVVPAAMAVAPVVAKEVTPGLGEAYRESQSLGNLKGGTEDIFRASVPGAGSKAFDLRDNVSVAADDLAEIQRRTPITGKGGIVRPDMRLRSAADNIDSYMQDELWKKQVQPQIDRWAKAQVDTKPLKQAMLDTITATDRESNPAGVRAVEKWATRMPDNDTLAGLAERRKTINAYLRDFEKSPGSEQAKAMQTKPLVEALKAQDRAIQQQMFAELRRRGEPGIDGLERRYAALAELRDAARSQMNAAESFRLLDRIGFYLNPKNLVGMHERLTVRPTSGRLMEQGMKQLEKTGIEPPPRPSQGPAPQTPTNRMLPAAGETGQGGAHPALGTRAPGGPKTELPPRTGYESEPGTFAIQRRVNLGKQAPGGPKTTPPAREVGESGGARSEFRSPKRSTNLGVSSTRETPGGLAKVPGGKYRTPDVNVIKGGTATPEVRLQHNQPASSLPLADKWAEWRSKAQSVVDDPLASQKDKVAARQTMKMLARTTRTGPAQPEVEPHLAELVQSGKLTHGEILRMSRTGVLGEGAAARIFRLARGKGIPPPPAATVP
jgi:hypothetical protein